MLNKINQMANLLASKNSDKTCFVSSKNNSLSKVTDSLWLSGATGAVTVLVFACWYSSSDALHKGVFIFGIQVTYHRLDSILLALVFCAINMLLLESVRLKLWYKSSYFCISDKIRNKKYFLFIGECCSHYLINLAILFLVINFFHTASEYGFIRQAPYYQSWFRCLEWLWLIYLYLGVPYVVLTRALKFNRFADKHDLAAQLWSSAIRWVLALSHRKSQSISQAPIFPKLYKSLLLSIVVKIFFAPLMTVFFVDQFPHLVANIHYVFSVIPSKIESGAYSLERFNSDLFNVSVTLIFSIDVAIAWCGYIVSSRWFDNQTYSTEPTVLGWMVCLCCYPPFYWILSLYYSAPNERTILDFSHAWVVTILTIMMVCSYFIYMLSTLYFGVRFSNLTNRGIIRTGPYAWVRHPAYAAKNFAWWCVMFPVVLITAENIGMKVAIMQVLGLIIMTGLYYMRAKTEEQHLLTDPNYWQYCQDVRYRFIPRIF